MTAPPTDSLPNEPYSDSSDHLAHAVAEPAGRAWHPAQRVLFRFVFVYLGLYSIQFLTLPVLLFQGSIWVGELMAPVTAWLGTHVLGLSEPVQPRQIAGGDTMHEWLVHLSFLIIAVLAAAVWSVLDRRRQDYRTLHDWLRILVRYTLGFVMAWYGAVKVLPSQFPPPNLYDLLTPFGQTTPVDLLWIFMGYSYAYSAFTGFGEMIGGILLFFRRTTLLGALILIAVLANVVVLNFVFIDGKLFTTHLLLMAIFIAAPDLRRLANLFVFNRPVLPADQRPPVRSRAGRRVQWALKAVIIAVAVIYPLWRAQQSRKQYGDLRPKPPLYGIYEVDAFERNGQEVLPLPGDSTRWRRVVVNHPGTMAFYLANDSIRPRFAEVDTAARYITLSSRKDPSVRDVLRYAPTAVGLRLHGTWRGDSVRALLRKVDHTKFPLLSREFRWVSE